MRSFRSQNLEDGATRNSVLFALILLACLQLFPSISFALTATAKKIYERASPAVYQIQVIDVDSGEKSVIGSGFLFSKDGLFATNYHVISETIEKPERYRIEYHQGNGEKGTLTLKSIDVAHDLAILRGNPGDKPHLPLGKSKKSKGDHVFPMGNPMDLGMTIIEGTYNGLIGDYPYQQILLSAPLNGGMSGGPAVNSEGHVIGINVAGQGENLSYLIPVECLTQLAEGLDKMESQPDWVEITQAQILKKFEHVITKVLEPQWTSEAFGLISVPKSNSPSTVKCWGRSRPEDVDEREFHSYGYKWCESEQEIFLSSEFSTGTIGYSFIWLESESLNPLSFYKVYSEEFAKTYFYPYATEKEVDEFNCRTNFIKLADQNWKAAYCVRQYKKYSRLHDVFISFALLGDTPRKYLIRVGLGGVNEPLANRFLKKFLGGIEWHG